ncbi:MAG: MerR family transcriptional regulator [Candidatus Omnitrophica bacterium]|nr:MerR family transcriptional regulator [Candidatus Omnitrophota bacterium]
MISPLDRTGPKNSGASRFFSISYAAKTVGVSPKQLYYWEYLGIIKPQYEQFGSYSYRRYSQEDVELLTKVRDLLNKGYTLRAAAQKAKEVTVEPDPPGAAAA